MEILNLKKVSKQIDEFLEQEYFDLESTHESTQRLIEDAIRDKANLDSYELDSYEIGASFDIELKVFKFDSFKNKINFGIITIEVLEVEIIDEYEYDDGTTCDVYSYVTIKAS